MPFQADRPEGVDGALTGGGADMAPARERTLRALRLRWRMAIVLGTTAKLAARMHAKLASVGREGGNSALLSGRRCVPVRGGRVGRG
jgi:hypothetical protein